MPTMIIAKTPATQEEIDVIGAVEELAAKGNLFAIMFIKSWLESHVISFQEAKR